MRRQFAPPESRLAPAEAEFIVGPKQMVRIVRDNINLPIESENKGVIVTDYRRFDGEWHIVRRWQEHTRFKITIIPDWDRPAEKCRVQVTEETEQRATESQPWQAAAELNRHDRSEQLLQQISAAANKPATK